MSHKAKGQAPPAHPRVLALRNSPTCTLEFLSLRKMAADRPSLLGSQHVKGVELLEQARAPAVESGDRAVLGIVCNSLGHFHRSPGKHDKAMEEHEQARAIAVELGLHRRFFLY